MAAASLFLTFLPLLAGQILLNNLLSDVPAIGIADDAVDPELIARPQRWNMRFIGRFMLEFGAVSSLFDFLTFGALLLVFYAPPELFRTGWFVESLLTELVIALVVRTRRPFFRSRPGGVLLWSTVALVALTVAIPYLPFIGVFGFVPLPGMDRKNGVPVEPPEQTSRIEGGGLPDSRAAALDWHHRELQPASAGKLHVGGEPHQPIGLVGDDGPAVDDVSDNAALLIAPPAIHADSPEPAIQPATHLPHSVAEVPAIRAADAPHRCECLRGRHIDDDFACIHLPCRTASVYGLLERGAQWHRINGERFPGRGRPHDRRVLQSFDERASDLGLRRRDEGKPQGRQMRSQNRHRQQQAAQPAKACVLPHGGRIATRRSSIACRRSPTCCR